MEELGLRPQSPQQQTQTQQQRWRGGGRGQQGLKQGQGLVEGQQPSSTRRLQEGFGELEAPGQYEQQQHEQRQQQGKRLMPATATVSTDRTGENQDTASLFAVGGDHEVGGVAAAAEAVETVVVKGVRGASASSGEGKDVSDKEPPGTGVGVEALLSIGDRVVLRAPIAVRLATILTRPACVRCMGRINLCGGRGWA